MLKERILEQAGKLFYLYGIKNVSMDDLASTLGVSKRTIYENFKDKEWVKIHATVKKEKCDAYQGEGPVLYVSSIAATTKPDPEMVSF